MYSRTERLILWILCIFGFTVINITFLNGLFFETEQYKEAMKNPIALVFMIETFILLGLFTYLLVKWEKLRIRWWAFVGLSFLGSMLFALPIALLWERDGEKQLNGTNSRQ